MRSALLLAVTVLGQALAPESAPVTGADALPGVWEGRRIVTEAGSCELTGERPSKQPVELTVRRNDDGTFTARRSPPTPGPDGAFEWTGRVDGDRISFWTQKAANCDGRSERYLLRTSGKLPAVRDDGKLFMRLRAVDPACGCAFDESYELTLKAPGLPD
jgi:hypothetical protein